MLSAAAYVAHGGVSLAEQMRWCRQRAELDGYEIGVWFADFALLTAAARAGAFSRLYVVGALADDAGMELARVEIVELMSEGAIIDLSLERHLRDIDVGLRRLGGA